MALHGLLRVGRLGLPAALGLVGAAIAASLGGSCTLFSGIQDIPPPPPLPDAGPSLPAYLSLEDAARVCSLSFRCPLLSTSITYSSGIPVDPTNYSDCMTWLAGPIPPSRVGFLLQQDMLHCMAKATTCVGATACAWDEQLATDDPRCAGGDAGADAGVPDRCDDNGATVLVCNSGFALHCGTAEYTPGSQCRKGSDGILWCSDADTCNVPDTCRGSVLDYCGYDSVAMKTTGLHFGIDCAAAGNSCGLDTDAGLDSCLTEGVYRPCVGIDAKCAGDVVEVCNGATVTLFKCAELDATCAVTQGPAQCVKSGAPCTPFDTAVNVCNGDKIHL